MKTITGGKVRRYFSLQNIVDIPKFFIGLFQAFFKMYWLMPDVIFSTGGTGALPVVLAGWFYRVPIIILEPNAVPGTANLLSSRLAYRIGIAFEKAISYFDPAKTALVGNPVRKELTSYKETQATAKEALGFSIADMLIVVISGSQGAQRTNDFILLNLEKLLGEAQLLHQTGVAHYQAVEKISRTAIIGMGAKGISHRYLALPYLDETRLPQALRAADLVISRAGAGSIFELAAFGKPAILIPIRESANDHQRMNAYEYAKTGAAVVIEEGNLLPGIFLNQVKTILAQPGMLAKMSEAASRFYRASAAAVLAKEILGVALSGSHTR